MSEHLILTMSCPDQPGLTANVTGRLFKAGGNILEAQQFNDRASDRFFMRVEFDPGDTRWKRSIAAFLSLRRPST
ncbi:formyltetrahydrofolate deformylase [Erythrobacter sp. SD-21]|nr:formyltetrahydrofolate deformylase [Erythrobacter sp. SD-21]